MTSTVAFRERVAEVVAEALSFEERAPRGHLLVQQANRVTHHLLTLGVFREEQPVVVDAAAAEPVVWRCAHCGDRIKQLDDDVRWTSLEDFGGTGTGAYTEKLWCTEGPGHDHSPNFEPEGSQPTREQIAAAIHDSEMLHKRGDDCPPACDVFLRRADVVLALLNGAQS